MKNLALFLISISLISVSARARESVASANEDSKTTIPFLIKRNELLTDLYREYIENSEVLDKKEFHLEDAQKYKCEVWNIATSNTYDQELILDSTNAGGSRAIHMRLGDSLKEKKEDYLLAKRTNGWRGSQSEANSTQRTGLDIFTMLKELGTDLSKAKVYNMYAFMALPGSKLEYRSDKTVCFTANKENPSEIFIELGKKASVGYLDSNGKEIDTELNHTIGFKFGDTYLNYHDYAEFDVKKLYPTIIYQREGNHSLPSSHCYRDYANDPLVVYRMEGLGFCTLR